MGERVDVSKDTAIYHDLWLAGDDAGDLLDEIRSRFGADFRELWFPTYFPSECWEAFSEHLLKLIGLPKMAPWKRLTVGHLIDVVQRGVWFEPPTPNRGQRLSWPCLLCNHSHRSIHTCCCKHCRGRLEQRVQIALRVRAHRPAGAHVQFSVVPFLFALHHHKLFPIAKRNLVPYNRNEV